MLNFDYNLNYNMFNKQIIVNLSDKLFYNTNFVLGGVRVLMQCGYSPRTGLRWIILVDSDSDVILSQTYLKYKKRCELNFNANLNNLNYYVTLKTKDPTKIFEPSHNYENWAKDFDLCFVGHSQELEDRLQSNLRIIKVGN